MDRDVSRSQLQQSINALAAVALAFFVTAALHWAAAVLIPIALAVLITFLLTPLVLQLQRRGLGRVPSVALVLVGAFVVIAGVGVIVGEQMVDLFKTLPDHADRIRAKVMAVKNLVSPNEHSRFSELVNDLSETIDPSRTPSAPAAERAVVVSSAPPWFARFQSYLTPAAEALGQGAFTLILVVFMLLRREDLRNRAIRLLGAGRITATTKAVDETGRRISRFLLAQFLLNSAFGLVIMLGLFLMRVGYAPLWGFVAFLMRYVPYIGTWIGVIPAALFTIAVSDGWGTTVGVLVLFLGLEIVCANFIEPMLYGPRLGLSEVAQLVATAFWALLWGPVGIILAWPLTTCALMLGKYAPQLRFLNVLLGDEPPLPAHVTFYQRLAARDQDEAAEIIEKELSARQIEPVFDEFLIPALARARQDAAAKLLSEDDLGFIIHGVGEIAEDIAEFKFPEADAGAPVRVLLIPAKDSVDHAAAAIFTKVLEPHSWTAEIAPVDRLASELIMRVEVFDPAVAVIVAVAPGGITHARYVCKRIRSRFPSLKLVVGRWADSGDDGARAIETLRKAGAEEVTPTLAATHRFLHGWRTVFAAGTVAPAGTLTASIMA
jgi:predicted PurR-regulated permease PerM